MDQANDSKELIYTGIFAAAMGVLAMLFVSGVIPTKGSDAHAPLWVGLAAGLVFVLAGGALILRGIAGGTANDGEMPSGAPLWMHIAQYIVGLVVIGSLAAIGTWVAFGPGERAFSMSLPFFSGPANQWIGRAVFGFGAVLVWLFFAIAAVSWGKRIWRRANV